MGPGRGEIPPVYLAGRRSKLVLTACACAAAAIAGVGAPSVADAARLRSKLPLVAIRTAKAIPDDPKLAARVRVIDRPGRRANRTSDPGNVYAGRAGIELRGHSSQLFPKKQYGLELRDRKGDGRDAALLGMPADDDWVLSANYSDKTLMRNALAYRTARTVFGRYAPQTRHVELMLNGRYRGVYVLTQKIELGEGRVEAEDGWMLELVFGYQARGERHFRSPRTGRPLIFTDPDDPDRRQARGIRRDVVRFERALYGKRFRHPRLGWRSRLEPRAAVDYVLLQELFGNQDAFHASTYFYRPPEGRIVLGPLWDFDIAMGNTTLDRFRTPPGWHLGARPYVERLYRDRGFVRAMAARWRELRRAGLRGQLRAMIARDARQLRGPQARNFQRWRILGRYVWPNPVDPRTGRYRPTWRAEVAYLKRWLDARITWIDRALPARARRG
jgi:CotH kinase protein